MIWQRLKREDKETELHRERQLAFMEGLDAGRKVLRDTLDYFATHPQPDDVDDSHVHREIGVEAFGRQLDDQLLKRRLQTQRQSDAWYQPPQEYIFKDIPPKGLDDRRRGRTQGPGAG